MGTDIAGFVEVLSPLTEEWYFVIDISMLAERNYNAFGCLFGVKNTARFIPIAARRGVPDNLSTFVQSRVDHYLPIDGGFIDPTWIHWAELKTVDWDEQAPKTDLRIHEFRRDERGEWVWDRASQFSRPPGYPSAYAAGDAEQPREDDGLLEGTTWEADGKLYRSVCLRRSEAVGDDWRLIFHLMETLASAYGGDGVRLIVWFNV